MAHTEVFDWQGERYFPIGQFYRRKFGEKVYKISVSVAETCPVRKGKDADSICIFCDEWGSAAAHLRQGPQGLVEQILENRERVAARYKANKFLVYFQPYTNTFDRLSNLERNIQTALDQDRIAGIVLGTRPDCLPKGIFPMLKRFAEQAYVSVELGAQSFFEERVDFLKRGHTAAKSIEAVHKLKELAGVHVGVHLIFGLPDETREEVRETATMVNGLPIDDVKLHNLHVLKNTHLEALYRSGEFKPIELEDYAIKVADFLEVLSPRVAVQRLAATAPNWEELIAPEWTKWKMKPTQAVIAELEQRGSWQGKASGSDFAILGLSKKK